MISSVSQDSGATITYSLTVLKNTGTQANVMAWWTVE
jgi:hypothetical protein